MKKLRETLHVDVALLVLASLIFVVVSLPSSAFAQSTNVPTIVLSMAKGETIAKAAPGELLPVSVSLSNFAEWKEMGVLVKYEIIDSSGKTIYSINDTLAIEPVNNFTKTLQIPYGVVGGDYKIRTSVIYRGRLLATSSEFPFRIEPTFLGLTRSGFALYGGIIVLLSGLSVIGVFTVFKHRKVTRLVIHDYSNIPRDQRVFYELISDAIMGVRQRVGDQALDIAAATEGLTISETTGRVEKISGSPSKVIAELVSAYERILGKKVSFSFRPKAKKVTPTRIVQPKKPATARRRNK